MATFESLPRINKNSRLFFILPYTRKIAMQLTYRGINYETVDPATESSNKGFACRYSLTYDKNSERIAWVRSVLYYTYRGVSYTKSPLVNAKARIIPDKC